LEVFLYFRLIPNEVASKLKTLKPKRLGFHAFEMHVHSWMIDMHIFVVGLKFGGKAFLGVFGYPIHDIFL